ncbi:MAG TPA: AMP-binding protein [Actinomycetota bacterium]|nr:AMP-binding protein [Actinomycetota bacterium]
MAQKRGVKKGSSSTKVVQRRPFLDPTPEAVRAFIDAIPFYAQDTEDPTFWPDERLRDRQDELLRRQMGWLAEASPHYRGVFERESVDIAGVKTVDDLVNLPVTTKKDLMSDPQSFRMKFTQGTLYDLTYATVYTTGTTMGWPTPYEYTTHDFFGVLQAGIRNAKLSYYIPGDLFLTGFPLSPLPHVAGFGNLIANAAQVGFLHGFTGIPHDEFPIQRSSAALVGTVESQRPPILAGIGSFLRRMFADAAESGRDLSSLEIVIASGEVLTKGMRDHMHANLARCGADQVFITGTYGFTEGGLPWAPCYEGGPLHPAAPDQVFLEILDPDTHQRVPDGQPGLVALTHLNRRGMPLLRYLLGDVSAITHERCDRCGRGGGSLLVSTGSAHITRTSELLKIKGTLVNPQMIHDVVMNTPGIVEYQMIVTLEDLADPYSQEKIVLRLGLEPAVDRAAWEGKELEGLTGKLLRAAEMRPHVEIVDDLSTIYDPGREFKARRIIDERPKAD